MLINGVNLETFGVELYDRVLSTNSVTTRRDWLDGDIQPTFIRQQDKFKSVQLSFLVLNVNEDEAFKRISRLTHALKRASIEFDDIHLVFDMMLVGKADEKRLKNGNFIVTYNLISDYAKGEREVYTTDANSTNSTKLTILYYQNSTTLLATDSVTIRASMFDDSINVTLGGLGINVNKYRPSYHNEGIPTNLTGTELTYESLRDLQVLIINYEPTRYTLTVQYFLDSGSGVYSPIASNDVYFTAPHLTTLTSIGQLINVSLFKPEGYKASIEYNGPLTVDALLSASPIYVYYTQVEDPRTKTIVLNFMKENDDGVYENFEYANVVVDETSVISGMTLSDIFNIEGHRPNRVYYQAGKIYGHELNELVEFDTLEPTYDIHFALAENIIYVEYYAGNYPSWYRLTTVPVVTKYKTSYEEDFSITDVGISINQYHTSTYHEGRIARGDVSSYDELLTLGIVQIYYEPIDFPITVRYWKEIALGTPIAEEIIYINELDFFSSPVLNDIIDIAKHRPEGWQLSEKLSYNGEITLAALTQASPINIVYEEIVNLRVKNIIVKYKQEMASTYAYVDTVILTINEADTIGGVRLKDIINLNLKKPEYYDDGIIDGYSSTALLTFDALQANYEVAYLAKEYFTPVRYFFNEVTESGWIGSTNIHYRVIDFSTSTTLYHLGLDINAFKPQNASDGELMYTGPVNFESLMNLEAINVVYKVEDMSGGGGEGDLEYPHRFLFLQHNDLGAYENQHPTWSFTHSYINTGVTVDDMSKLTVLMECKVFDPDTPMHEVIAGTGYLFGSSSAAGSYYMRFNNQTKYGYNLTGINLYEAKAGRYTDQLALTEEAAVGFSANSGITSSQRAGYSYVTFTYTNNLQTEAAEMRYPLYLFANNNVGKYEGGIANVGIYSCRIYYENQLIRDFIPVRFYDKIGNKVAPENGLYDKVSGTFFTDGSGNNGFNIIDDDRYVDTNPDHNIGSCFVNYHYGEADGFSRTFFFRESEFLNGEITDLYQYFSIDEYQRPYYKPGVLHGADNLKITFANLNGKTFNVYYEPETNVIEVNYWRQDDPNDIGTRELIKTENLTINEKMFYQSPTFGDIVRLNKYRPDGYQTDFVYEGFKVSLARVMEGSPYNIVYVPETDTTKYTFKVRYIKDVFGIRVYETIAEEEIELTAAQFREGEYIDYFIDFNKHKPERFYGDGLYYGQYRNGELLNWYAMDEPITTPDMLHELYIVRYPTVAENIEIRYYVDHVAEEQLVATAVWSIKFDDWDPRIDDGRFQIVDEVPNEYVNFYKPAYCRGGEWEDPSRWYTFEELVDQGYLNIIYPIETSPHDPEDDSYEKKVVFFGAMDAAMYPNGAKATQRRIHDYEDYALGISKWDGIGAPPPKTVLVPEGNNNNPMDRGWLMGRWITPSTYGHSSIIVGEHNYPYIPGSAEQQLVEIMNDYKDGKYPDYNIPDYVWNDLYRVWGYYGPRSNSWAGRLPIVDLGYNPKDVGRLRVEIKAYAQSSGYKSNDTNPYGGVTLDYLHFFGYYSPDIWFQDSFGYLGINYPTKRQDEFYSYEVDSSSQFNQDPSVGGAGYFSIGIDVPIAYDYVYTAAGPQTIDGWPMWRPTMSATDAPEWHPRNRLTYSMSFRRGYHYATDDDWNEFDVNYAYGISQTLKFYDKTTGILATGHFCPSWGPNCHWRFPKDTAPQYNIDTDQGINCVGLYGIPVTFILDAWNNYAEVYSDLNSNTPRTGYFRNDDNPMLEARPQVLGTLSAFGTTNPMNGTYNVMPHNVTAYPGWSSISNWKLRTETIAKGEYNPYAGTYKKGYTYDELVGTSTYVDETGQTQIVYTYQTKEVNVKYATTGYPAYPQLSGCAIWGIKIYDRDKLVRDLIPVGYGDQIYGYKMPGNGFFDKVTEIFFGNSYRGGTFTETSTEYNEDKGYSEIAYTNMTVRPTEVLPLLTIKDPTILGKVVVNYYDWDNTFIDNQYIDVPTWISLDNTSIEEMLQFNDFKPDDFHLDGMVDLDKDITYESWTPAYIVDMGTVNVYYKLRTFAKTVTYYQDNKRIASKDIFYSLQDIRDANNLDDLKIDLDLYYDPNFAHGRLVFDERIIENDDMAAFIDAPSPVVIYDKLSKEEAPNLFYVEYYRGGAYDDGNKIWWNPRDPNYLQCNLTAKTLNPTGVIVYLNHYHSALYEDEVFDYFQPYQCWVANRYAGLHKGPGKKYMTLAMIVTHSVVTIVEERNGWGRLKEYPKAWIPLSALVPVTGPGQNPDYDPENPKALTIPFGTHVPITRLTVDRLWAEFEIREGVYGWIKTEEISYDQQGKLYNALDIDVIDLNEVDWKNADRLLDVGIQTEKRKLHYHNNSNYQYDGEYTFDAFSDLHEIDIVYPETLYNLNAIYYKDDIYDPECELGRAAFSFVLSDWNPDWDKIIETSWIPDENGIYQKPTLYRSAVPLMLDWEYFGIDKNLFKPDDAASDGIFCWNSHSWEENPRFSFAEMITCPGERILYPCINPTLFKISWEPASSYTYLQVTNQTPWGAAVHSRYTVNTASEIKVRQKILAGSLGTTEQNYDLECAFEPPWTEQYFTTYFSNWNPTEAARVKKIQAWNDYDTAPEWKYRAEDYSFTFLATYTNSRQSFGDNFSSYSFDKAMTDRRYTIRNSSNYRSNYKLISGTITPDSSIFYSDKKEVPAYPSIVDVNNTSVATADLNSYDIYGGVWKWFKAWSQFTLTHWWVPLPGGYMYKYKDELYTMPYAGFLNIMTNEQLTLDVEEKDIPELYLTNQTVRVDKPFKISEQVPYETEPVDFFVKTKQEVIRYKAPLTSEGYVYTQNDIISGSSSGDPTYIIPQNTIVPVHSVIIPNEKYPTEYYYSKEYDFWINSSETELASRDSTEGMYEPIHTRGIIMTGPRFVDAYIDTTYRQKAVQASPLPSTKIRVYTAPNTLGKSVYFTANYSDMYMSTSTSSTVPTPPKGRARSDVLFSEKFTPFDENEPAWLFADGYGWIPITDTSLSVKMEDPVKTYIILPRVVQGFSQPHGIQKVYYTSYSSVYTGWYYFSNPNDYLVKPYYVTHHYYQGDRVNILYRSTVDPLWAWTGECWIRTDLTTIQEVL